MTFTAFFESELMSQDIPLSNFVIDLCIRHPSWLPVKIY